MMIYPETMRYFLYKGIPSTMYFYTVSVNRSILPGITLGVNQVPNRAGAYISSMDVDVQEFSITVGFYTSDAAEVKRLMREVATWLYSEEDEDLIFSDEPDKYYKVRFTGRTDITETDGGYEVTLNFVAGDPFAYSNELANVHLGAGMNVVNDGTYETFPYFRVVPNNNIAPYFRMNKGSRYMHVTGPFVTGQAFIIDHEFNVVYQESNGMRMMNRVDLGSDFFELDIGDNEISVPTSANFTVQMFWRERFL